MKLIVLSTIIVILLYLVLRLADQIVVRGKMASKRFWKNHIVDEFPYPDECFDCHKGDCGGCLVLSKYILKKQGG